MTSMNSPLMKSINPIVEIFYLHPMTADATSLHCPNCGAPAAPGDQGCKYCHAVLATVSCPACFAVMFEGSVYCPKCGARRARAAAGGRTARCAACKDVMREVLIGDTALMECDACHGMWIDAATFEHICADKAAQAAVLHQWSAAPKQAAMPEIHYRRCVACGKMMNRMNFGRISGTVVDVCKGHGTFLDAGELHLIVTFIHQGGLDRARQRQIDELKEQEEQLRALRDARSRMPPEIHIDRSARTWTGVDLIRLLEHLRD
jgi:Zn-finger nucleic acid-binding protein